MTVPDTIPKRQEGVFRIVSNMPTVPAHNGGQNTGVVGLVHFCAQCPNNGMAHSIPEDAVGKKKSFGGYCRMENLISSIYFYGWVQALRIIAVFYVAKNEPYDTCHLCHCMQYVALRNGCILSVYEDAMMKIFIEKAM